MTKSIIDRADALLKRCLLCLVNGQLRIDVKAFLAREPGRPRKVDKEECKRLRAAGYTAEEIATKLGCHACNVRRSWK